MSELIPPERKKRGRKPGCDKTPGSGRKPNTPNKISRDLKEVVLARGKPLELLCDISRGLRIRVGPQAGPGEPQYAYPTLQERVTAAKILIDKIMPTASSTEITGKDGVPLLPPSPQSDFELANIVLYALAKAQKEIDGDSPPPSGTKVALAPLPEPEVSPQRAAQPNAAPPRPWPTEEERRRESFGSQRQGDDQQFAVHRRKPRA